MLLGELRIHTTWDISIRKIQVNCYGSSKEGGIFFLAWENQGKFHGEVRLRAETRKVNRT